MNAQAKEIKNKVMCEIDLFAIVYFFFDDRQQTAWSQGSSKYRSLVILEREKSGSDPGSFNAMITDAQ
jgi:hypothetical protein